MVIWLLSPKELRFRRTRGLLLADLFELGGPLLTARMRSADKIGSVERVRARKLYSHADASSAILAGTHEARVRRWAWPERGKHGERGSTQTVL